MKKNVMMRVASALLVAVLLTTCAISGTFAKYVTTSSANDTAKVAKWGVEISSKGYLFSEQYTGYPAPAVDSHNISVQVSNYADATTDNVVAPGTFNSEGIVFTISGTPEVDVELTVDVEVKDIVLPAAEAYTDFTDGNKDKTFELVGDYHPVIFTLTNGKHEVLIKGMISEIEYYLETLNNAKIDSNTDIATAFTSPDGSVKTDGTYRLTWEWPFEQNNKADTYIGNVMAGVVDDENCTTDLLFDITITAEQAE